MNGWRILGALVVVWALVYTILGCWIAVQNGRRKVEGGVLGLLLGPLGVVVEAFLPSRRASERHRGPHLLSDADLLRKYPAIAERLGRKAKG